MSPAEAYLIIAAVAAVLYGFWRFSGDALDWFDEIRARRRFNRFMESGRLGESVSRTRGRVARLESDWAWPAPERFSRCFGDQTFEEEHGPYASPRRIRTTEQIKHDLALGDWYRDKPPGFDYGD